MATPVTPLFASNDVLSEIFFFLDAPSALMLSLTCAHLRRSFASLAARLRFALAPPEAEFDPALDPLKISPGLVEACIRLNYDKILSWIFYETSLNVLQLVESPSFLEISFRLDSKPPSWIAPLSAAFWLLRITELIIFLLLFFNP